MLFVAKLGPIPFEEGEACLYIPLTEDGPLQPVAEAEDAVGLRAIAEAHPGHALVCEESLLEAGRPYGYSGQAMPEWARLMFAALATRIALVPAGDGLEDVSLLLELLVSAAQLTSGAPWRWWDSESVIEVEVQVGDAPARLQEACLLGADGIELGLVLFDRRGSVEEFARLAAAGDFENASSMDFMALLFADEPAFACKALERVIDVPLLPVPQRMRGGEGTLPDGEDLAVLAAAAQAVALINPQQLEATAELGEGAERVRVTVKAPEPTVSWAEA